MASGQLKDVLRRFKWQLAAPAAGEWTDRQLLNRFASQRDEMAFAALVRRHGPLVLGVGRRILRHDQDAEDVFQATFLILARKAASGRWQESIAGWLYCIARRLATRTSVNRVRGRELRKSAATILATKATTFEDRPELHTALDEEVQRLSDQCREPLLLCYVEGKTRDQAARQLGWSVRTLERRLQQGLKLLRVRLCKRGVELPIALLIAGMSHQATSANVSAALVTATVEAAVVFRSGAVTAGGAISITAVALAQGGLKAMQVAKLKTGAIVLFALSVLAAGLGVVGHRLLATEPPKEAQAPPAAKPAWLEGSRKDLRIKLAGKILEETGAPANGCKLTVILKSQFAQTNLPAVVERNQFQVWVPISDASSFNVYLNAVSPDGRRSAWEAISAFQLRQAALGGLELTIKQLERTVDVTVVEKSGGPVRDAIVLAEAEGVPFTARTNDRGVASFALRNRDKLAQLTAWTEDFKIGGYLFSRKPPRDPSANKYTIELEKCRPQVIRVINDENKSPVPDLKLVLTVGTGAPNHQFIGETPACEMTTDHKGDAVYRWFPDWKTHGSYVTIPDPRWTKTAKEETVDGVILVRVRKSRFDARKRVVGQVTSTRGSVAGLHVEMWSFQGEEQNRSDVLYAFTDENGTFAADYLPGTTYCIYVNDARYVSNIIDLIPYDAVAAKTNSPSLTVSEGQPVEISVTRGPAKSPVAYQWVQLATPHSYSWRESGATQRGQGGRRWWVTTNEQGKARTFALPGEKIEGSLYTPEWRSELSAEVKTNGVTRLEFHREHAIARTIKGRLLLPGGLAADLNEAVIEIGSLDGETEERLTRKTNDKGEFQFESKASRIGIYARTRDARAATVAVIDRLDQPVTLDLKPTGEYRGQLLGKEDRPLHGHAVRAEIRVSRKGDDSKPFATEFLAATFDAKTDAEGNYSFSGLPCEAAISLRADSLRGSNRMIRLEEFYLMPHESRPRIVSKLWKPERKISFAERYDETLRDCRLSNFGAMVVLFRSDAQMNEFVEANFMNSDTTKEIMAFMQIKGSLGDESAPEIAKFARSKHWPLPDNERVFALAMDPAGRELGQIEIDAKDPAGPKRASDFIRQYAPAPADARQKWDEAFAEARESGRKVWVRISQRYCRPCFLLTRWLDEQKKLLAQDYVFLKIDDVRDLHGAEVAKRLPGSERQGVPFQVIFDSDGKSLITSESALGNIGHPDGFEGKNHLRKMILHTRNRLTDRQVDEIVNTLRD
jgi:RNA polymerase sigma factor (sigma-70 family)